MQSAVDQALVMPPYLMFLGDAPDQLAAKVADGVAKWRPDWCLGQLRLPGCMADVGLPDLDLQQAWDKGCRTLLVGVANRGGVIPQSWHAHLLAALEMGYDIASGLHEPLTSVPGLGAAAARLGRRLVDVRHSDQKFAVAAGKRRPGKRLLTVGTDCSAGKMFTALAITRSMQQRALQATFRATGQTGIFIAGNGVAVDAVIADFIAGSTEWLTPANAEDHWDIIEGQGSLFHPSFAGVSLGLLHGAMPDRLIMCHEPTRTHLRGLPHYPLPDLRDCIALHEKMARIVNPDCRVVGLAINSSRLAPDQRADVLAGLATETGLPTVDPFAQGADLLVDALLASY